jgi:hypothetical protein
VNKYGKQLLVLPEDRANATIARGFALHPRLKGARYTILPEAGGWVKALEKFRDVHVPEMQRNTERVLVLLIDFDEKRDRFERAVEYVPLERRDRVFVLGVWSEPERLKADLNSSCLEKIGTRFARACNGEPEAIWAHPLLKHNEDERQRLQQQLGTFLFEV